MSSRCTAMPSMNFVCDVDNSPGDRFSGLSLRFPPQIEKLGHLTYFLLFLLQSISIRGKGQVRQVQVRQDQVRQVQVRQVQVVH